MKVAFLLLALAAVASSESVKVAEFSPASPFASRKVTAKDAVSDLVIVFIEVLAETLRDEGYDPLILHNAEIGYALPVPYIFTIIARAHNLHGSGISNIVINNVAYNAATSVLAFDITLPWLHVTGSGGVDVIFFSKDYASTIAGSLSVDNINLKGNVKFDIGADGVDIQDLNLDCSIGGIRSDLSDLSIVGNDVSGRVNNFINERVLPSLNAHKDEVNTVLEAILLRLIDRFL